MMNWNTSSAADRIRHDPAAVFAAGLRQHHIANTAYPIAHNLTLRPYRVPRLAVQQLAPRFWDGIDRLSLYVHIPFCERRCGYCEYTVLDPAGNRANEQPYFDLLLREFELYRRALDTPARTLIGFDIGGGTPSAVHPDRIAGVIATARTAFNLPPGVDISIETTPRIAALEPDKLHAYHQMGIRRISMGVQTVNSALLRAVGRDHGSMALNEAAAVHIRQAGFDKFNLDVMYGFAGQSLDSLEATLRHVIALGPEYVTLYRMRYKGTRLIDQANGVHLDEVIRQARLAKRMLLEAGYAGAPGKNTFSRVAGDPGTSHYLTERVVRGAPYLGLGLGAQSLAPAALSYNAGAADKRLDRYRRMLTGENLPIQDLYHLSLPAAMAKMISVAFYFGAIHLDSFIQKFGIPLESAFPEQVDFVLHEGLMEIHAPGSSEAALRLTEYGEAHINGVIALFYTGAVQTYLLRKEDEFAPAV